MFAQTKSVVFNDDNKTHQHTLSQAAYQRYGFSFFFSTGFFDLFAGTEIVWCFIFNTLIWACVWVREKKANPQLEAIWTLAARKWDKKNGQIKTEIIVQQGWSTVVFLFFFLSVKIVFFFNLLNLLKIIQ